MTSSPPTTKQRMINSGTRWISFTLFLNTKEYLSGYGENVKLTEHHNMKNESIPYLSDPGAFP
jgi:hypothetical protein